MGSFQTSTTHGTSASTWVSSTGAGVSTGAVVVMPTIMADHRPPATARAVRDPERVTVVRGDRRLATGARSSARDQPVDAEGTAALSSWGGSGSVAGVVSSRTSRTTATHTSEAPNTCRATRSAGTSVKYCV